MQMQMVGRESGIEFTYDCREYRDEEDVSRVFCSIRGRRFAIFELDDSSSEVSKTNISSIFINREIKFFPIKKQ